MPKLSGRFCKMARAGIRFQSEFDGPKNLLQAAQSHNYKTGITSFLGGKIASEPAGTMMSLTRLRI